MASRNSAGKTRCICFFYYSVLCWEMSSFALLCKHRGNRICINYSKCNYSQGNLLALSHVIVFTADYSLLLSVPLIYFTHLSFEIEMKCWCIIILPERYICVFYCIRQVNMFLHFTTGNFISMMKLMHAGQYLPNQLLPVDKVCCGNC